MASRRTATWIAIFAMAVNALWPLLARAQPSEPLLVAVICGSGEGVHAIDLTGKPPAGSEKAHGHCELCVSGDRAAALPEAVRAPLNESQCGSAVRVPLSAELPSTTPCFSPPRGPPAIL
jgi:hypothetical protein